MANQDFSIYVGELGLSVAFAHLTIIAVDDSGRKIFEVNGLATNKFGQSKPIGAAIIGDTIKGYYWEGENPTYLRNSNMRSIDPIGRFSANELDHVKKIVNDVITQVNSADIPYQMLNTNSNAFAMTVLSALGYTQEEVRAITKRFTPGLNIDLLTYEQIEFIRQVDPPRCFPAQTPIAISPTQTKPIADIRAGDVVMSYDSKAALGRGALVPRRVVRMYRGTTQEWVKLTWNEGGEAKELIATPGHHFLDQFGNFPTIEAMLENGRATAGNDRMHKKFNSNQFNSGLYAA